VPIADDQMTVRKKADKSENHAALLQAVGEFQGGLPPALAAILASLANPASYKGDLAAVEHARIAAIVEGTRIAPLDETARLLGISKSSVKRLFPHLLVRIGERNVGMKLKDIWELAKPAKAPRLEI
jgi:hypothetical protein